MATLKAVLRKLAGSLAVMETTTGGWGDPGRGVPPAKDLTPQRVDASPPAPLVQLHQQSSMEVLAACGVPIEVVAGGEGSALREAHRRFLFSTIAPLGRIVSQELTDKLETPVALDWAELRASDVVGRARAFQSMVGGGMDVERAAGLSGLLAESE